MAQLVKEAETPIESIDRELTIRGFILGAVLAIVLGAANAYLGLYAGMTVSASIPAAVISMAVLRMLGRATILENNVVQTIASAGEAVAAGAIFTFPALLILGGKLRYWDVTMLSLAGGVMGSLLVVFLRRAYIVEEQLPFPEGRACAEVLRAGAEGGAGASALAAGGITAALLKTAQDIFGVVPSGISGARWISGAVFSVSANISAALLGVGYIVGAEIGALVLLGGVIGWLIALPLISLARPELHAIDAATAAQKIWSEQIRYLGVGAMLVGGGATLWRLRRAIFRGLGETVQVLQARRVLAIKREETDVSPCTISLAIALCVPAIFGIVYVLSGNVWLSAGLAVIVVMVGFFATAVAGYLTGIVGASNNPVSGVTIIVLLALALILRSLGVSGATGPQLAILAGAVLCTAAAMAGDSLHDLATGYHLGATPRALEIAMLAGAGVAAFVMAPVLNLLIRGYGIVGMPGATAHSLAAPQAFLMAKVAQGVFSGNLPWGMIALGAALAFALLMLDQQLEQRGSRWRTPIMPVAIGLYLPFGLGVMIMLGGIVKLLTSNRTTARADTGLLLAAGLVAGEALMGVASGALITAGVNLPLGLR